MFTKLLMSVISRDEFSECEICDEIKQNTDDAGQADKKTDFDAFGILCGQRNNLDLFPKDFIFVLDENELIKICSQYFSLKRSFFEIFINPDSKL